MLAREVSILIRFWGTIYCPVKYCPQNSYFGEMQ